MTSHTPHSSGSHSQPAAPGSTVLVSTTGLLVSLPYLVGFVPHQSLVLLMLGPGEPVAPAFATPSVSGPRACEAAERQSWQHRVLLTMRFDLKNDESDLDIAQALQRSLEQASLAGQEFVAVKVVVWSSAAMSPGTSQLMPALQPVFAEFHIAIESITLTDGDAWCEFGAALGNQPESGRISDDPYASLDAELAMLSAGYSHVSSRAQLQSALKPSADALSTQVLDGVRNELMKALETGHAIAWRRQQEDSLERVCRTGAYSQVSDSTWARWAIALGDSRVREPLIHRLVIGTAADDPPSLHQARRALHHLTSRLSGPEAAPVAATLAVCAWQAGDGAAASIAAERALSADATNTLARIVLDAARLCVPPQEWRSILARFTLWQLRELPTPECEAG